MCGQVGPSPQRHGVCHSVRMRSLRTLGPRVCLKYHFWNFLPHTCIEVVLPSGPILFFWGGGGGELKTIFGVVCVNWKGGI